MKDQIIETDDYQQNFLHNLLTKQYQKKIKKIKDEIIKNPEKETELKREIMLIEEELQEELRLISNIDKYEIKQKNTSHNLSDKKLTAKQISLLEFLDTTSEENLCDNRYRDFKKRLNKIKEFFEKNYCIDYPLFLNLNKNKIGDFEIPSYLYQFMFEFQRKGVIFLQKNNVLLADEMGLGKTLQIISLLACKYMTGRFKLSLILSPVGVISHWIKEIYKYFPFLRILVYHNSYEHFPKNILQKNNKNTVIITSYQTFLREAIDFYSTKYDFLILDEGHKIKNDETKIFKALNSIKARSRLILTGTPIQNNLRELWCLLNFIRPGLLGNKNDFDKNYLKNSCSKGLKLNETSRVNLTSIKDIIKPFILRREKEMLQHELPHRLERVVLCPMTEYQESLYEAELLRQSEEIKNNISLATNSDIQVKRYFGCIFKLRNICNYPQINGDIEDLTIKDLKSIAYPRVGKFEVMKHLLKKFGIEKRKTLIFTQTLRMLDFISEYLSTQNILFERIEGKITLPERDKSIKRFKDDSNCNVMIITTRVGSLGLNLVMASRLIIYDPDWNPSVDKQARERIFRFGQKNDVETYVLLALGTIEEKIYQKQLFKTFLSNDILSNKNKKELEREMKDMLTYKKLKNDERNTGIIENIKEEKTKKNEWFSGHEMI
ncbi:DNA excision repair protein ERCC-6 [Cucumispora dikerogammari]|nr:DNA excision repair protein ERCC-6 [Cucumispora dikerogammari]